MSKGVDPPGGRLRDLAGAVAKKLVSTGAAAKTPRRRDRALEPLQPLPGDPAGGPWASARPTGVGGLMPLYDASDPATALVPSLSDEMREETIDGVAAVTVPVTPKPRVAEPPRATRQEPRRGPAAWLADRSQDSRLDQLRTVAAGPELGYDHDAARRDRRSWPGRGEGRQAGAATGAGRPGPEDGFSRAPRTAPCWCRRHLGSTVPASSPA